MSSGFSLRYSPSTSSSRKRPTRHSRNCLFVSFLACLVLITLNFVLVYESDIKQEQNKRVEEDLQGEKNEREDKMEVEHVH